MARARRVRTFGRMDEAKLVEAIVVALDMNNTAKARNILERLLAGEPETYDDANTVEAVSMVLAANPCVENEDILFGALTEPEKLRPGFDMLVSAEDLRASVFASVSTAASERFRERLAEHFCRPNISRTLRRQLGGFLEENLPENLGAQLILYSDPGISRRFLARLEAYFAEFSSQSLGEMLQVQAETSGRRGRRGRRPVVAYGRPLQPEVYDPELPFRLARRLWSAEPVAFLETRLGEVGSLEETASLIALAATIPVDSTRAALYKTLHANWKDGPGGLNQTGLVDRLISDPGFLILVKTLPREEAGTNVRGPTPPKTKRARPPTRPKPTPFQPKKTDTEAARQQPETAKRDWMTVSRDLVLTWCERFRAAAEVQTETARRLGRRPGEAASADLPVKLHKGARVVAEYRVDWPGNAEAELSGVTPGPMQIHYIRTEERAKPLTVLGYYRRQLKSRSTAHTIDNGAWIESLRAVPQTDQQRSIDIVFTAREDQNDNDYYEYGYDKEPDEEAGKDAADGTDLNIEILSITMKDPAGK